MGPPPSGTKGRSGAENQTLFGHRLRGSQYVQSLDSRLVIWMMMKSRKCQIQRIKRASAATFFYGNVCHSKNGTHSLRRMVVGNKFEEWRLSFAALPSGGQPEKRFRSSLPRIVTLFPSPRYNTSRLPVLLLS